MFMDSLLTAEQLYVMVISSNFDVGKERVNPVLKKLLAEVVIEKMDDATHWKGLVGPHAGSFDPSTGRTRPSINVTDVDDDFGNVEEDQDLECSTNEAVRAQQQINDVDSNHNEDNVYNNAIVELITLTNLIQRQSLPPIASLLPATGGIVFSPISSSVQSSPLIHEGTTQWLRSGGPPASPHQSNTPQLTVNDSPSLHYANSSRLTTSTATAVVEV
ncbi:unnamed protein product [Didymodactylos carnosus]|uniref:Uncharacterized protein n=1 Tax=Didymodactylos carnosus TaxID=1234261 RepID=A0A814QCI1_9BILA|nr:unnamed protein product [Didymodactylos carnosus]CAF3881589.1 unnamed protein product [Didymodactylos carnosus]